MFKVKKGFTVIEIAIVVAIVAILAGVWYMQKNRAGADVVPTGAGGSSSQKNIPPKVGMGQLSGLVKGTDDKPIKNVTVNFVPMKCKDYLKKKPIYPNGNYGGVYYRSETHSNGKYLIGAMPPGFYCGSAMGGDGPGFGVSFNTDAEVRSDGIETKVNFNLKIIGDPSAYGLNN